MSAEMKPRGVGSKDSGNRESCEQPNKKRRLNITDYMTKKAPSQSNPSKVKTKNMQDVEPKIPDANDVSELGSRNATSTNMTETDGPIDGNHSPDCGSKSKTSKGNDRSCTASERQKSSQSKASPTTLAITESIGDIFDAPRGTLIIHSCNCRGSWGAGIAAAFKSHYPNAYKIYAARCQKWKNELFESAQLISPQKADRQGHFVGCLYTSRHYGKKKDTPEKILSVTGPAMQDLLEKVKEWNDEHGSNEQVQEVRMCMINSGLFAVPWEETRAVLEGIDVSHLDVREVKVISRE